jgi:AbrB family looped-hinge helix DNA binding protein
MLFANERQEQNMVTFATVKGQVVIPAALRKKLGITSGTKFHVFDEDGRIVMQPITREYIRRVRGSLINSGAMRILINERKREREL